MILKSVKSPKKDIQKNRLRKKNTLTKDLTFKRFCNLTEKKPGVEVCRHGPLTFCIRNNPKPFASF